MTTPQRTFLKDPSAILDYQWDWTRWLASGESIVDAEITTPDGLELESISWTDTVVTGWFSGGTVGKLYSIPCSITTSNVPPRTEERTMKIKVVQR